MATCKACSREIIWKVTTAGRPHPFDARQTLVLVEDDELGAKHVLKGHVSHFATCPHAEQFSRKTPTENG